MRVIVQDRVYETLDQFYEASMEKHPTLDLQTVLNKEDRLFNALKTLGENYYLYHEPRFILDWIYAEDIRILCAKISILHSMLWLCLPENWSSLSKM